jgi:hypothetical protein
MSLTRDIRYFKKELAANPSLRSPDPRADCATLTERSREWRCALRSYDAACLELGIKTPAEIQAENSPFARMRPRLVAHHVVLQS